MGPRGEQNPPGYFARGLKPSNRIWVIKVKMINVKAAWRSIWWKLLVAIWHPFPSYAQLTVTENINPNDRAFFYPYTPEVREYGIEIGSMWENDSLYWLGGKVGFHLGNCIFNQKSSCQQYLDLITGVGGRDGETLGYLLAGLRWQFVDLPRAVAPSVRLLAGMVNVRDSVRDKFVGTIGMDYSWSVPVHPSVDLKATARAGYADDRYWSQAFIGADFKIDRWIDDVSRYSWEKLKASGELIKRGVRVPVDWVFEQDMKKK